MKGHSASAPRAPNALHRTSGNAEPRDETKNNRAATNNPPLRPIPVESGPASAAPITQPSSAQPMVKPDSQLRAPSARPRGSMKFTSVPLTAPEVTAGPQL